MNFTELYNDFQWFFELGYVTILATILTMLLVNLEKVTIFKKVLTNASSDKKDKILSLAGTITSFIIYGIVFIVNEMITQHTFLIIIDWTSIVTVTIPAGAVTTWLSAKGLYTLLHKWIGRLKAKAEVKKVEKANANGTNEVAKEIANSEKGPQTLDNKIGSNNSTGRKVL